MLRIEWDGTPHRVYGNRFTPEEFHAVHKGVHYVGLDNDRTMVRIGWMNMILHGIENPQIHQCDSLGKRQEDDPLKESLASESYDLVLANPPFTGTVDSADLDSTIFPKAGTKGKRASLIVTNKSELLFIWRMLDLLHVGGRCAVIVPEGVLFGNTDGHVRLRRELLTEHKLEAVISLPAGVFQPYTGVKTSILVFQKETREGRPQQMEACRSAAHPYGFGSTRSRKSHSLWTPSATSVEACTTTCGTCSPSIPLRNQPDQAGYDYFQPDYSTERWRMVDAHTLKVFSGESEVSRWKDQVAAISELFDDLPPDPEQAFEQIDATQKPRFAGLARRAIAASVAEQLANARGPKNAEQIERVLTRARSAFRGLCEGEKSQFDLDDRVAYRLYRQAYRAAADTAIDALRPRFTDGEPRAGDDQDPGRHPARTGRSR